MHLSSEEIVEDCRYVWDGTEPGWILFHVNADQPDAEPEYAIVHEPTHQALIIEDDSAYNEIKRRMQEAGIPVITAFDSDTL